MKVYSPTGTLLYNLNAADFSGFNFLKIDNLTPGTYKINVTATWLTTDVPEYTIRAYGNSIANITFFNKKVKSLSHPIIQNFSSRVNGSYAPDAYRPDVPQQ